MSSYMFRDLAGDYLLASPSSDGDGVDVVVVDAKTNTRTMVTIPARRLSEVMTGLYQQAGRPVPNDPDDGWVRHPKGGA